MDADKEAKIIEGLTNVGFFFEQETRNKLKELNFELKNSLYIDKDENNEDKTREIDFVATSKEDYKINENLIFKIELVGECKQIDNSAIVVNKIPETEWGNLTLRMPLATAGSKINFDLNCYVSTAKRIKERYGFDCFVRRLVPFAITKEGSYKRPSRDGEKETVFSACAQVSAALKFKFKRSKDFLLQEIFSLYSINEQNTIEGQHKLIRDGKAPSESMETILKNIGELSHPIHPSNFFAFVILKDGTEMYEINENKKLTEIDYFVYLFPVPNSTRLNDILMNSWEFPIFVCKQRAMQSIIEKIRAGQNSSLNEIQKHIKKFQLPRHGLGLSSQSTIITREITELMMEALQLKQCGIVFGDPYKRTF